MHPWEQQTLAKRVIRKAKRTLGWHSRYRVGDASFIVPQDMTWAYFADGSYCEKNVAHWLIRLCESAERKIVYDIGANYGYYPLLLAPLAKQIYAFEPVEATYRILMRNIRRNHLQNVVAYKLGCFEKNEDTSIYLYGTSGTHSLFRVNDVRPRGTADIRLVRLDDFLTSEHLPLPDVLKIDVEGAELQVLRGAECLLHNARPAIIAEYSRPQFKGVSYMKEELVNFLSSKHYTVYGLAGNPNDVTRYPLDQFETVEIVNLLALPE